jgi:hypothetical protein
MIDFTCPRCDSEGSIDLRTVVPRPPLICETSPTWVRCPTCYGGGIFVSRARAGLAAPLTLIEVAAAA